jgi:hypothetical protein
MKSKKKKKPSTVELRKQGLYTWPRMKKPRYAPQFGRPSSHMWFIIFYEKANDLAFIEQHIVCCDK